MGEFDEDKTSVAWMVRRAQDGCNSSQNDVLMLVEKFKNNLIVRMARQKQFTVSEIEDAQQEGVFWVIEAIQHYDAGEAGSESKASFSTFLFRVITFRFKDLVRRQRRVRVLSVLINAVRLDEQHGANQVSDTELATPDSDDPTQLAQVRESTARLDWALAQLDENSFLLWRLLASGMRLRPIAEQLGISYEAARRRRRQLIADVKSQLE